jgi:hypothetical protein
MRLLMALAVLLLAAPPKAKAPPAKKPAGAAVKPVLAVVTPSISVLESVEKPAVDYQAEVYSGVPLDDPYARGRGVDKGLVRMVFQKQRKLAFRVAHERIKKRVRYTGEGPKDHVDVLDTEDGFVVVETTTSNAGIFTTSDVYLFAKNTTVEQRLAMVTRERVRQAMTAYR